VAVKTHKKIQKDQWGPDFDMNEPFSAPTRSYGPRNHLTRSLQVATGIPMASPMPYNVHGTLHHVFDVHSSGLHEKSSLPWFAETRQTSKNMLASVFAIKHGALYSSARQSVLSPCPSGNSLMSILLQCTCACMHQKLPTQPDEPNRLCPCF
jgi:hypothetical protein